MKITINKKKYEIKNTIRAMLIFEQITKKPFSISTLTDEYVYFYSLLLANNKDIDMDFNDFIDAIDKNMTIIEQFGKFMVKEAEKTKLLNDDEDDNDGKKKD